MVGFLTYGNKKFQHLDDQIRKILPTLYNGMKDIMMFVDRDAAAYTNYMVSLSPSCSTSLPWCTFQASIASILAQGFFIPIFIFGSKTGRRQWLETLKMIVFNPEIITTYDAIINELTFSR